MNPLLTVIAPVVVVGALLAGAAQAAKDKDEIVRVLGLLARDDPSFRWRVNEETGQMIVEGVGELHLEIVRHRIERDFKMQIRVGAPRPRPRGALS